MIFGKSCGPKPTVWCFFTLMLATVSFGQSYANVDHTFLGDGCAQNQDFMTNYHSHINAIEPTVRKIIDYVVNGKGAGQTYEQLAQFVDKFGSRIVGSQNLENSIDYMLDLLKREGHQNVHGENVVVPRWTRGTEWAYMVKPRIKRLNILGLGYGVGTGPKPIKAPILLVNSFEELEQKAAQVPGKVVVYNFKYESYSKQAEFRVNGPNEASKFGAVAAMVRSLTPFSINSPHTGMTSFNPNVTKIPSISITTEDADMFQRLVDRNETVEVKIFSENRMESLNAVSRNTVSELVGTHYPDQVVLVSGHLDSWDVGQGAMDDGAGAFISWRALSVLRELNLKPKRTIRSVLWTGEEFGLIGAKSYVEKHSKELKKFVIAMESDEGTFSPLGLTYSGKNHTTQCVLWKILSMMKPINATKLSLETEGSDVTMFNRHGVPISSLMNANEKYFYFHHTDGDMLSVESSDDLDRNTALWTAFSYAVASIDKPLYR